MYGNRQLKKLSIPVRPYTWTEAEREAKREYLKKGKRLEQLDKRIKQISIAVQLISLLLFYVYSKKVGVEESALTVFVGTMIVSTVAAIYQRRIVREKKRIELHDEENSFIEKY